MPSGWPLGRAGLGVGDQQVGEAEQERETLMILGQAAVSGAAIAEALFDVAEGVLDLGAALGTSALEFRRRATEL